MQSNVFACQYHMKSTLEEIADLLQQQFDIEKADLDPDKQSGEHGVDSPTQIE